MSVWPCLIDFFNPYSHVTEIWNCCNRYMLRSISIEAFIFFFFFRSYLIISFSQLAAVRCAVAIDEGTAGRRLGFAQSSEHHRRIRAASRHQQRAVATNGSSARCRRRLQVHRTFFISISTSTSIPRYITVFGFAFVCLTDLIGVRQPSSESMPVIISAPVAWLHLSLLSCFC